jgi:hypothetical protein
MKAIVSPRLIVCISLFLFSCLQFFRSYQATFRDEVAWIDFLVSENGWLIADAVNRIGYVAGDQGAFALPVRIGDGNGREKRRV